MPARDRGHERSDRKAGSARWASGRIPQDGEVQLAADDPGEERRRVALGQLDADERVPLPERLDALDRTEGQRRDDEPDVEPAGLTPTDPDDLVQVALHLVEERPRPTLEHVARRRERHTARGPDEQVDTEVTFGAPDLLRQGGLRDPQSGRCPSEVQFVRDGQEGAQLTEVDIHAVRLSMCTNEY